jgi:hypothetical protein
MQMFSTFLNSIAVGYRPSAVVLLCHSDNPRIIGHFERLRSEAGLPVFRARHVTEETWHPCTGQDIPLRDEDLEACMPLRMAAMKEANSRIAGGYADLIVMAAASHPSLAPFATVWLLEYDVDFTGSWAELFARYRKVWSDLIGFRIQRPEDNPGWNHWKTLKMPDGAEPLGSFIPAMRLSRRFIERYRKEMDSGAWAGHIEATVPSVAAHLGMSMIDMSADAEFSRHDGRQPLTNHDTFGYRPIRSSSYFHEAPEAFPESHKLYHPVKV